jgi:hypothetical protein
MENGGTAQPTDLVERTRLPLNAITTQLKRLKDAQIVELLGGGKGRAANYTVPDKLFAIWYQMRYLNQNRRRIELFVEVLRIWFEAEERFATIQSFAKLEGGASPSALHEADLSTEYFAASLANTRFASEAQDDGATNEANNTLDRLAQHLATKPSDQRVLALTRFLADLASPEMLQGWLHAARRLLGAQPPETRQALVFLEPVCAVLEGGEKSLLDPLPPEQREFALNVLARFDAEKAPSTPPVAVNADSAQPNLG